MAPHKKIHRRNNKNKRSSKKNEKKHQQMKQVAQVNKNEKKKQVNKERENLTAVETIAAEKDQVQKDLDDYMLVKYSEETQPLAIVKEEPPFVENELSFILDSQIQAQIKTEKLDAIEKIEDLGGGVKRKRQMKMEKVDYVEGQAACNDVEKSLISCLEDVKLLISNLPATCTQPDLVRLFSHYNSLQCTYMVDYDASGKSLAKAVLIFNDRAHAKQVIKEYNGLLLDGCDVALKVELISSMRRYEYGSPLHLIHYQVVKSPSLFKHTFNNNSTIKWEI